MFVHLEENHVDIFTKNLKTEKFDKHCEVIGQHDAVQGSASKVENRKGVETGGLVFITWI